MPCPLSDASITAKAPAPYRDVVSRSVCVGKVQLEGRFKPRASSKANQSNRIKMGFVVAATDSLDSEDNQDKTKITKKIPKISKIKRR